MATARSDFNVVFDNNGRMSSVLIGDVEIDRGCLISLTESRLDFCREVELEVVGKLPHSTEKTLVEQGCRLNRSVLNGQITTYVTQQILLTAFHHGLLSSSLCMPNRDRLLTSSPAYREAVAPSIPVEEDNVFAPREVEVEVVA